MDDDRSGATAASLRVERLGAVLHVTLDRPARANALDRDTVDRFLDVLDDPAMTTGTLALIIAGSGENFCGGFDLSGLEAEDEAMLVLRFLRIETLLQRLYHAPFITVACAHGNAVGAGADLFAACAYRVAAPDARYRMPGWQFGIALGTRRLCDRIGAGAARDVLSANRALDASEAVTCGLATHVAEKAAWTTLVDSLVAAARIRDADAREQLYHLTVPDHRDADMAALVASLVRRPGIKERIVEYARKGRSART